MLIRNLAKSTMLIVAALITACGGGSGGSTSSTPSAATSVVTIGTITGFGSVFVNGVRFDVSAAQITVNGQPGTQADLRVGQVVKVKGKSTAATAQGTAQSIEFDHNLEGPIENDPAAGSFMLLGQTVMTDGSTSFDPRIPGAAFAGLKKGDVVEVSGFAQADGSILATRIELESGSHKLEVRGVITVADDMAKTFNIGDLVVDYSQATLQGFTAAAPAVNDVVKVKGSGIDPQGRLTATQVELKTNTDMHGDGQHVEIEGLITVVASDTTFTVNGQDVLITPDTKIEVQGGASGTKLAKDMRVEVEGQINAAGVLEAKKIEVEVGSEAALLGMVDSVDTTDPKAPKVVVQGITVTLTDRTRLEDRTTLRIERFSLADLGKGDTVVVRGAEVVTNGVSSLVASRLERVPASDVVLLGGLASALAPTEHTFKVLGQAIVTDMSTVFSAEESPLTAEEFFMKADGKTVRVKATVAAGVFTATQVKLGGEHD
jgi:Domain of unknown function (DUF5666)